jgi:hypothetical protein
MKKEIEIPIRAVSPHQAAEKIMKEVVDWANAHRGNKVLLAEEYDKLAKGEKPVNRRVLELWTHPEESKRRHPRLGSAMILIQAKRKLESRKS